MAHPAPTFILRTIIALACVLATASIARAAMAGDFLADSIARQGVEPNDLPFRFYVPELYEPSTGPYPLIVFLHGSGERGNNNTAQLNNNANGAMSLISDANQAAHPAFMLAPQASVAEGWNANTLAQVMRAIERLQATYVIDADRIIVTGLSMGGGGTWDIVRRYPFHFAAAAPICGWGSGDYARLVSLPIWSFHAVNDPTVGVAGSDNAVSAVRQAGGRVIYTRYATGGHGIWNTVYASVPLFPWMMAQRRNSPSTGAPILSVVSPGPGIAPPPGSASLTITGTGLMPTGFTAVHWTTSPWTGSAGIDTSTYTLAAGTETWSAAAVPNSAQFLVVATGPSGTAYGGVTTVNDFLWKPTTTANTTPATVAITSPTSAATHETSSFSIDLTGTAGVASGKTVQAITWRNHRGGAGTGVGTTSWSIESIDLQPGANIITVTARDSHSITGSTTITVNTPATSGPARLLNLSTRALAGTGDASLIPGFVISGAGTKRVLLRAAGPSLGAFGIPDPLADPRVTLKRYDTTADAYVDVATNDDWGSNANASAIASTAATVGAFAIEATSRDAALLVDLAPGRYSAVSTGAGATTGVAIVELYDADDPAGSPTAHLVNISNRGHVGAGNHIMIPGFVVSPGAPRTLLIRAVGPKLASYNVTGVLADPRLSVLTRPAGATTDSEILSNDNWGAAADPALTALIAQQVGAFPLDAGSADAALVAILGPGVYTVQASGVGGTSGIALVEVYLVP